MNYERPFKKVWKFFVGLSARFRVIFKIQLKLRLSEIETLNPQKILRDWSFFTFSDKQYNLKFSIDSLTRERPITEKNNGSQQSSFLSCDNLAFQKFLHVTCTDFVT